VSALVFLKKYSKGEGGELSQKFFEERRKMFETMKKILFSRKNRKKALWVFFCPSLGVFWPFRCFFGKRIWGWFSYETFEFEKMRDGPYVFASFYSKILQGNIIFTKLIMSFMLNPSCYTNPFLALVMNLVILIIGIIIWGIFS
jgi:hypothetical protein